VGRIRSIKPELPQSATLGRVSRDGRLCFVLLFTLADDEGRMRGEPALVASLLFPYDQDARERMPEWLQELQSVGAIRWYQAQGQSYVQIVKWADHQRVEKPKPSAFPPPPDDSGIVPGRVADESPTLPVLVADESPTLPGRVAVGREGKGRDQEGKGAGALAPVVAMPRYMRGPTGAHATCVVGCDYGMCLPESLAVDLAKRLPGGFTEQGLQDTVTWATGVIEDRVARGLGMPDSSVYAFWKHRWAEQFGGSAPSFAQLRNKRASDAFDEAING